MLYEQIAHNKRNTRIVMVLFCLVILAIAWPAGSRCPKYTSPLTKAPTPLPPDVTRSMPV